MWNWTQFYVLLFLYRCSFSLIAQTFVTGFTTLGDSRQWQRGGFRLDGLWFLDSNKITDNVGATFSTIAFQNPVIINILYQSLAFYGLYKLLQSLDEQSRKRLAILLLFPSFNLWTSIAGKEAVLVFALGILGAYIVDMYSGRDRVRPLHVLAAFLVAVYKVHYGPALIFLVGVTKVASFVKRPVSFALVAGISSLVPLYIYADEISALSFEILPHFVGFGNSSRDIFWLQQYDVFTKAPYGMFQGFFGPTLGEALNAKHALQPISFVESLLLVALMTYHIVKRLPEVPVFSAVVGTFVTFWILFPNYPFGIMNPGSAVRYRSGFIIIVFVVLVLLTSRETYLSWRGKGLAAGGSRLKNESRIAAK